MRMTSRFAFALFVVDLITLRSITKLLSTEWVMRWGICRTGSRHSTTRFATSWRRMRLQSAALSLRKLLMHVAVEKGAPIGQSFQQYVTFFETNNLVPMGAKD